jgi:hypothetical protein
MRSHKNWIYCSTSSLFHDCSSPLNKIQYTKQPKRQTPDDILKINLHASKVCYQIKKSSNAIRNFNFNKILHYYLLSNQQT